MSNFKTNAFPNVQYLALGKPVVFQSKREENRKSENTKTFDVVRIWTEMTENRERQTYVRV